jgi:hypothetical protein
MIDQAGCIRCHNAITWQRCHATIYVACQLGKLAPCTKSWLIGSGVSSSTTVVHRLYSTVQQLRCHCVTAQTWQIAAVINTI